MLPSNYQGAGKSQEFSGTFDRKSGDAAQTPPTMTNLPYIPVLHTPLGGGPRESGGAGILGTSTGEPHRKRPTRCGVHGRGFFLLLLLRPVPASARPAGMLETVVAFIWALGFGRSSLPGMNTTCFFTGRGVSVCHHVHVRVIQSLFISAPERPGGDRRVIDFGQKPAGTPQTDLSWPS